jgi:hypothetical protein
VGGKVDFISKYNKFFLQTVFFLAEKMVSSEMALQVPILSIVAIFTAPAVLLVANMTSEMILAEMEEEGV